MSIAPGHPDDEQEEADRIEAEQEADDLSKVPHCDCGSVTCLTACKSCGDLCCRDCLMINNNFDPPELWCWRCMDDSDAQEDPEEFCEDGYDM